MWNKSRSIKLSKICIYIFAVTGVFMCICIPFWFRYVLSKNEPVLFTREFSLLVLLITGYLLAAVCYKALFELYGLLTSIEKGDVFINKNIDRLRIISWLCMAAAILCLIASPFYNQTIILFCIGAFIGLVLRVVKNVFASAVQIKEENDFTI